MFVFSCTFSSMLFATDDSNKEMFNFTETGVGMNTFTVAVGGTMFALFSGCRVSIAGPDITPTLFFSSMRSTIAAETAGDDAAVLPTLLLAIWLSTLTLALLFLALGHFRLTRVVQFLPASLLCGFLV